MTIQALSNLRVVEYGEFVSGPYCGKLLADLGAEVIKVEKPGLGDKARSWGPFPQDIPHPEKSGLFLFLNANKLGVTLNMGSALGVKIFKELAKHVDIIVESNLPQEMKRLELDCESLHKLNPRLVVTSVTAFGQTGPYRDYKGSDLISFHTSGEAGVNPAEGVDDIEHKPPLKGPMHVGDFLAGLSAAVSTMSAVIGRRASGLGQHVDVSQQEALTSMLRNEFGSYSYHGTPPTREIGKKRGGAMLYPCRDGHVVMSFTTDIFWAGLVEMMGNPDWAKQEWCQNPSSRSENMQEVNQLVAKWTREYTTREIEEAARSKRIPCSIVRSVKDLVNDELLAERDFFVEIGHPEAGTFRYPGAPYKLSATPWTARRPAPVLGEHNEQIYCQMLGYTRQDLVKMRQAGVI